MDLQQFWWCRNAPPLVLRAPHPLLTVLLFAPSVPLSCSTICCFAMEKFVATRREYFLKKKRTAQAYSLFVHHVFSPLPWPWQRVLPSPPYHRNTPCWPPPLLPFDRWPLLPSYSLAPHTACSCVFGLFFARCSFFSFCCRRWSFNEFFRVPALDLRALGRWQQS